MVAPALRIEESVRGLDAQRDEVCEWTSHWRERDQRKQFYTQLTSLESTLTGALERLKIDAGKLAPRSVAEAHEVCRDFDRELF